MPQFVKSDISAAKPTLPVPQVTSAYDEASGELTVTSVFQMNYPEGAIIERLGKVPKDENGNPTGDPKPVTSKTYGKGRALPLGFSDADNNAVLATIQVFAKTAEAEADDAEDSE